VAATPHDRSLILRCTKILQVAPDVSNESQPAQNIVLFISRRKPL
jgi:hypothetical protein